MVIAHLDLTRRIPLEDQQGYQFHRLSLSTEWPRGYYAIRPNHNNDNVPAATARTAASAVNNAETSVSLRSSAKRLLRFS